ncbi:chorismate--pyruvate lyase family protein [Ursidibacter sp. B-7004-1]
MDKLSLYRKLLENGNWQTGDQYLSKNVADWLSYSDSLTQKLQSICDELKVEITQQGWQAVRSSQAFAKNDENHTAWLREVILKGDKQDWIFAQTILPKQTIEMVANPVLELGENPIGLWLFPLQPERISLEWCFDSETKLYARRSLLSLKGYPLAIYELFLPQFPFEPCDIKE